MDIRKQQAKTLKKDIEDVVNHKKWINKKTNNVLDTTRILGVLAAGKGSEVYLPYTIPKIISQISEVGIKADIIIGLNNGFECPDVVDSFASIVNTRLIHLYTIEKEGNNIPAKIFANLSLEGEPYRLGKDGSEQSNNRIFFVHQREGKHAAGKIRVLGDIYQLLLDSIASGWIPPEFTLTFDAESIFLVNQDNGGLNLESNGLRLLIEKFTTNPDIDILGTRHKFALFSKQTVIGGNKVLLPDFSKLVPPIQFFLNLVHGRYRGFSWKPAVGTIGKTDLMISIPLVIATRYPGAKIDDAHTTVLAQHAGFLGGIYTDVISLNRCPDVTDMTMDDPRKLAWMEQMVRWIAGRNALEKNYGRDNIRLVAGYSPLWNVIIGSIEFFKELKKRNGTNACTVIEKLRCLLCAGRSLKKINRDALNNPDVLNGYNAKGDW